MIIKNIVVVIEVSPIIINIMIVNTGPVVAPASCLYSNKSFLNYRVSQKNALSESSLQSYNPSKPTSLACRLQAASGDLSDVSACRMMILKVRFYWDTVLIGVCVLVKLLARAGRWLWLWLWRRVWGEFVFRTNNHCPQHLYNSGWWRVKS